MIKKRYLVALTAVSAALAACGSSNGNPDGDNPTAGSGGTGNPSGGTSSTAGTNNTGGKSTSGGTGNTAGSGTGGTSSAGTSNGGGSAGEGPPPVCVPGTPVTSQFPRMLNRQYDAAVRDLLGVTGIASQSNRKPSELLFADFDGPMNSDAWRLYKQVAGWIAAEVMGGPNRTKFINCDPATAGCLTETIKSFGRKAFRRPLTEGAGSEVERFEKLAATTPAGSPEDVATTTLEAFLVSPSFIYITELTKTPEGSALKLSSHEVAARLSFMLWGSVPDDALNAEADADRLQTKDQILAQAQRMIMDRAKAGPMVSAFHRFYLDMNLDTAHWWKSTPADIVDAASQEIDSFFEEVAFGGGTFKDMFLSPVGFVNNKTAPLYGLNAADYGPELTKVTLPAEQRPGFLTRVGFLSSYSHGDSTAPILRGAYITIKMIGVNPGPPSPDAMQVPAPSGTFPTNRAFVEALVAQQPSCQGCHAPYINPPGFVLEHYDAVGKWQDTDQVNAQITGGPIDGTAEVDFGNGNVKMITSPLELMQEIANGGGGRKTYAERWVQFATGRAPNDNDACLTDQLDTKLGQDGYTITQLLADLTQADSFSTRVQGN